MNFLIFLQEFDLSDWKIEKEGDKTYRTRTFNNKVWLSGFFGTQKCISSVIEVISLTKFFPIKLK
jgi:hypothetical protein